MKIWLNQGFSKMKPILVFSTITATVLFLSLILAPRTANAGLLSFISSLVNNEAEAGTNGSVVNSQNMPLLQATRNPNPSLSKGGDITIVASSALLSEAGPAGTLADIEDPKSSQISVYVVHSGDSLSGIAKMFGVSANTIIWANDITGPIQVGQKLIILPISGIKHTVVKGETLQSIAKKYKGDAGEIRQFNGLDQGASLIVGDTIIIPDGEMAGYSVSTISSTSKIRGAGGPDYGTYYIWPVLGGRKTQGLHGYNGIDIGASRGTPIMAAASGQVIISRSSGWNGGYGEYIVIAHANGTQTLYGHLDTNVAYEGSYVVQGQIIGYVGSTGRSTGPHLHFEVRGAQNPFR
ncbi:MAG: peptidoglycan DD-metalloendopeptidase family protein [Candidatus Paceibacterota bacterium]|jgi:LysM repeat protein